MAQIRIEGKVAAAWGDHLYLVYVNDAGQEFVIRGGPERDLDEEGAGFGNILTVSDVLLANSEDARPVSDRDDRGSLVLDLGGRDAASVWNIMVQTSKLINRSAIDYDFLTQNSNSVISAVLHSVGINYSNNLPDQPWNNDSYPGASNLLLDDFQRAFSGTSKSDKIFGGSLNDLLKGNSGNDTLSGGNGNDSLYGGSENDIIQGSAGNDLIVGEWGKDTLYGGSGTDWFAFNTAASSTNIDTIIGYSVADDTFMLGSGPVNSLAVSTTH